MELGVLAYPRVAVVQVGRMDVLVRHLRQDHKPFLQEFGAETVVRTSVCKVHDQLEGFMAEWLQGQDDMVDQEIAIGFTNFVASCYVIEHRVASS